VRSVAAADSTPVPCAASRETVRRSEFAGIAAYGYCRSHSRYFWGFRLYLLCASDGAAIAFELAPANAPEREDVRELFERVPLAGLTVFAGEGFAGAEFEGWMADRGAEFLRPDRKDEPLRFGSLGRVRQWIESLFWTCKGQLGLERHRARTLPGLCARVGLRLLALAAGLRHDAEIVQPGRRFSAYGH
jgi:Transposase DDE domain